MVIEKYDDGYISAYLNDNNSVDAYVNNRYGDVPEWDWSIKVVEKKFSNSETARRYFFELKRLIEFEEEETNKIPEGYVPVKVSSFYYGSHSDMDGGDIEETYYCRPENAEELRGFKLSHGHFSYNEEEAKKFYFFCLKNKVVDEFGYHAEETDWFTVTGADCYGEDLDKWLEEFRQSK